MADWYVSSAAWAAIPQFAASGVYTVGQIVRPLTAPAVTAQYAFRCTVAGTAGAEPAWPGLNNGTITTGAVTFQNVTGQSAYGWGAAAGTLLCMGNEGGSGGNPRFSAGDRAFLSSDHAETVSSNYTPLTAVSFGVLQFISVNRGGSVPPSAADARPGASITTSIANPAVNCPVMPYWLGVNWSFTGSGWVSFNYTGYSNKSYIFKNSSITFGASSLGLAPHNGALKLVLDNTTLTFGATGQYIGHYYPLDFTWINTSSALGGSIFPTALFNAKDGNTILLATCRGVDLSALTGTLVSPANNTSGSGGTKLLLDSCKIASTVTRLGSPTTNASTMEEVELVNCFDGTNVINERYSPAGAVITDRANYLTSGAQDDIGNYGLKLAANAFNDFAAFQLDAFTLDVENTLVGLPKTAAVEINSLAALNNSDIRLFLEYMGVPGSSLASFSDSFASVLTPSAALPSSSNSWTALTTYTAWNPLDNGTNISLSNNNLTVTNTNWSTGVRATSGLSSGKYYFEVTLTNIAAIGIGTAAAAFNQLGGTGQAQLVDSSGNIWINGSNVGNMGAVAAGNIIGIAVDLTAKLIWFRVAPSGNWNGNATYNPATGVGGLSFSAMTGPFYPMWDQGSTSPTSGTANFGPSGFSGAVPSGFTAGWVMPTPTVKQLLQVPFTPQRAGRLRGSVRLGKPNTSVWINPQLTLSNYMGVNRTLSSSRAGLASVTVTAPPTGKMQIISNIGAVYG